MLTENQKDLILNTAIDNGYQGRRGAKYTTTLGNFIDVKRLFKSINFPTALKNHREELNDVLIDFDTMYSEVAEVLNGHKANRVLIDTDLAIYSTTTESGLSNTVRSLYPVVNLSANSKEKILLLHPETFRIVNEISTEVYLLKTGQKEADIIVSSDVVSVIPQFNPYSLEPFTEKINHQLGVPVKHLNTYVPPRWRFAEATPNYGGFVKRLMEHLFPIAQEREDVLDWIHYAVTRRNGTILCLAGPRGTGKSLLMSIVSYLVGHEYSEQVNQEILEDKFNSAFKNKRLIIFEEVEVASNIAINKLKAMANNRIVLEEKGVDSQTIDNFTSMAILLNDISQLRIESQDRRFSVPRVADHDLRTVISEKDIQDFNDNLEGEEIFREVAEFGEYILERRPKRSFMYAVKGDYYYFLCNMAIAEWKNFIIEYVKENGVEGEPIPFRDMSVAFKIKYDSGDGKAKTLKFPDRVQTFELFLKDYKYRGDYYIGSYMKDIDDSSGKEINCIMPNPEFLRYVEQEYMRNKHIIDGTYDPIDAL